jgi:tricorn protease
MGWSASGEDVAFVTRRETDHGRSGELYHVSVDGGAPEKQMEARFYSGRWNVDGTKLAYIDIRPGYNGLYGGTAGWRGYRGGSTPTVRIFDATENTIQYIPGERVNDIQPFWLAGDVYFVSDRYEKRLNLHRFDPETENIERLTDQADWDIHWAAGIGNSVVYAAGGALYEFDVTTGESDQIEITINPDLPQTLTEWKNVSSDIQSAGLSPNGKRALITARGEVFTIPVEEGSTRNLSNSNGTREYTAIWSPAGDEIAWIEESLDGQTLLISDQTGLSETESHFLGEDFYFLEDWDAQNGRIIFTDNRQALHYIDLESSETSQIAQSDRQAGFDVALSPDGTWLAYTDMKANYFRDLMLYHFESGEVYTVSDGMADVASPAFSPDGKYLYFAASTNTGPRQFGLDMNSQERPYRAGIYALVLQADGESPFTLRAGDEEAEENESEEEENEETPAIDLENLFERKIALPVSIGNYSNLNVSKDGALFYERSVQPGTAVEAPDSDTDSENKLLRFDFEERTDEIVYSGLSGYTMSANGTHLLIQMSNGAPATAEVGASITPKPLSTGDLRMRVDPRAEWRQIFDEGWRMQTQYFYADNAHGLDWDAVYDQYSPLVDHVGRRADLNDLMVEMIAELQAGHNRVGGGDVYSESGPSGGLLGANFVIENDRWKISRIYTGESWNPFVEGPLSVPGSEANEGEYIIAVNGMNLTADVNLFKHLENTVNKQVVLSVSANADGSNLRNIDVQPVSSESQLRLWHWIETNRKAVDEATDGRVGYIYLPNTAGAGYTFFNRMFHAQLDKEALIIDERSNSGGQAADYIVEVLNRKHLSNWVYRQGMMSRTPSASLHGPKLMLIDQDAGSGGDFLPYAFRELGIGTLMGTRTWGGLIGISANPSLIDGGTMTVPHFRFTDADNNWTVENQGVAPDMNVLLDPIATNEGRDTQLEAAIEEIMRQLETYEDDVPREQPPLPTELGN